MAYVKRNKEMQADLRIKAYELRMRGKTWRQIGEEIGIGHETARRYVTEHLEATELPLVDEVRKLEVDRMLRYLDSLDERIDSGEIPAVGMALKVSERLCKMLGVDMPTRMEVEHTEVSEMDLEVRGLLESMQRANEEEKRKAAIKDDGGSE